MKSIPVLFMISMVAFTVIKCDDEIATEPTPQPVNCDEKTLGIMAEGYLDFDRNYILNDGNKIIRIDSIYDDGNVYSWDTYIYDTDGNLASIEDYFEGYLNERIDFSYDESGNLIDISNETYFVYGTEFGLTKHYYDEYNHLIKKEEFSDETDATPTTVVIRYLYTNNSDGNPIEIETNNLAVGESYTTYYIYNDAGLIEKESREYADDASRDIFGYNYQYNNDGKISVAGSFGEYDSTLSNNLYQYDSIGNLVSIKEDEDIDGEADYTLQTYEYDYVCCESCAIELDLSYVNDWIFYY